MGYASQYTGGNADSIKDEAARLVEMINELKEHLEPDCLSVKERDFLEGMQGALDSPEETISGKQVLWLRDIKDRLL